MWRNTVLLQAQQGILGNIIHLTLKKDGDAWKKYNLTSLHPGEIWSDVNAQEFSLFQEQRSETFRKQKWFQTILYLKTIKCYINLLPYLLIIIIPFDHKNSLVWQGRSISKVRNLKCRDVKSFAHCKREKVMTRT